ncbi:uncharacterized protein M6G45_017557 [Spheniscus humboldti]
MRRRKSPARAQGAALSRKTAGSNVDQCAAGPTQVLKSRYKGLFLLGTSAGRCTLSQEDQGTSWKGPARCSCSAAENERKFSAAFHPMFAPSLPGSAGTYGPAEPASSCPDRGLGPPLLRDHMEVATVSTSLWDTVATTGHPRLVFSIAYSLATAVLSLQRCLGTGFSTLKAIITLRKQRLFTILFLMSLAALAGACCGTSLLVWMLWAKNVPQVLLGQPAAELRSLRNALAVWEEQSKEMQQLRVEVVRLAAEIGTVKKEVQQMREAMSASTEMSDWALKGAGAAIDLQRSSSSSAWLCRVFWFLCAPPLLDTFVQPAASPGYCWPFQGSRTEVLIRLPAQIRPTAVTIQHTSKRASPLGTVSSAPRDFTVSGLDEEGKDETLLGTFTYTMQKEPTQTFPLQDGTPSAFWVLKLVIQSNWGKPGYTCIFRVRVHGKIMGTHAIGQTHVETFPR